MIQYKTPIRLNTPQQLRNTMRDQSKVVIDLSSYLSATLEVKQQGQVVSSLTAVIESPASAGVVGYDGFKFTQTGIWSVQFYVTSNVGNKIYGEPILITVVPNNEDLALTQLPTY